MIFTTATTVLALAATFISGGQAAAVKPAGETNLEARQANCNLTVGDSYCGWYLINNLRCTTEAELRAKIPSTIPSNASPFDVIWFANEPNFVSYVTWCQAQCSDEHTGADRTKCNNEARMF